MPLRVWILTLATCVLAAASVVAQAPRTGELQEVSVIETGLNEPWGLAVRPGQSATNPELCVAESGAGRIVRVSTAATENKSAPLVTGFPTKELDFGGKYKIGPVGLAFADKDTLIVGMCGTGPGADDIRAYALPAAGSPSITWNETKYKLASTPAGMEMPPTDGPLVGVAMYSAAATSINSPGQTSGQVTAFFVGFSDSAKIFKVSFVLSKAVGPTAFPEGKPLGVDAPWGITFSKRAELLLGTVGKFDGSRDAKLAFLNGKTGKLLLVLQTGLHDITGLAYSPRTGLLYAVDFAAHDSKQGGVFRLDDDGQGGVRAVLIAALDHPTAMAFAPDSNTLYVTLLGKHPSASDRPGGQLISITGL